MSSEDKRPEDTAEDAEEETSVEASEKEEPLFLPPGQRRPRTRQSIKPWTSTSLP